MLEVDAEAHEDLVPLHAEVPIVDSLEVTQWQLEATQWPG